MSSRESRWPFLYSSAGTRTHFAIRQSTVRELAITCGFISDAEDACGCDVLATMRFRKTQPQRKIRRPKSVEKKNRCSANHRAYAIFPRVCVFCSYCCRLLFYTLCAGCIAPCATPMAINSETPVIFADTPFSAGKANARDATKRSGQYSSHTSIRKR